MYGKFFVLHAGAVVFRRKEGSAMRLLFVNACMRGPELSRTHALCRAFLEEARRACPALEIQEHDLTRMNLQPVTAPVLQRKEALCDAQRWDDPLLRPAYAFARADAVLIGAPYWDLSFPAALKIWVENIYVRNLTFRYTPEGEPVGLAQGKQAVYITTAGSPVGENDWGAGYMRAVLTTLGIPEFRPIRAEGIDIQGWDVQGILRQAEAEARAAGAALGKALASATGR